MRLRESRMTCQAGPVDGEGLRTRKAALGVPADRARRELCRQSSRPRTAPWRVSASCPWHPSRPWRAQHRPWADPRRISPGGPLPRTRQAARAWVTATAAAVTGAAAGDRFGFLRRHRCRREHGRRNRKWRAGGGSGGRFSWSLRRRRSAGTGIGGSGIGLGRRSLCGCRQLDPARTRDASSAHAEARASGKDTTMNSATLRVNGMGPRSKSVLVHPNPSRGQIATINPFLADL